ncbi:MAG: AEC family transporter [Bacillota bacterium]|nr:AEC family transporter [Bacillota bacterium]
MQYFVLSFNVMMPVILTIALGYFLKKYKFIDDVFIGKTSSIIFKIALPILLFNKTANSEVNLILDEKLIKFLLYGVGIVFLSFIIINTISKYTIKDLKTRGAFIQGAFRSNFVIIGYPILLSLSGDSIVFPMTLLAVFLVPLNNILAVTILTVNNPDNKNIDIKDILKNIVTNPLIIGIVLGLVWSLIKLPIPIFIQGTFDLIQGLATPLALIGIGSMFVLGNKKKIDLPLFFSTVFKTIIIPVLGTIGAILIGLEGNYLAVLFISIATPTAATSFIMAKVMDSDYNLAANIVVATTALSSITMFLGIAILKAYNLI